MIGIKGLLFSVIILMPAYVYGQTYTLETVKPKIDAANKIIDEASKKYDYETISKYYEDDVVILPNNEPMILGKTNFIENEKKSEKMGIKVLEIESEIVDMFLSGNLVHEVGKYKLKLKIPGVPFDITDTGKYLVIWKIQEDGSVKIKLETWNNDKEK